jgi:protein TonB
MKHLILIIFIFSFSVNSYGQRKTKKQIKQEEYELKKKQEWDSYLVQVTDSEVLKLKIKTQKDSLKNISPEVVEECYLILHIKKTMMYPEFAMEHNIQGKVLVSFVVNKEGFVIEIEAQGPENGLILENEAIRIIEKLPKFIPSKCDGQPVDFQVKQAISFKMLY